MKLFFITFIIFILKSFNSFSYSSCDKKTSYKNNCFGTELFSNGNKYVGEWKDNKMHGTGTMYYKSNDLLGTYEGEWRDNKKNGDGYFYFKNEDVYLGQFKNDFFHGHGKLTNSNGDEFIGKWKKGKKHGFGVLTSSNGKVKNGLWIEGVFSKVNNNNNLSEKDLSLHFYACDGKTWGNSSWHITEAMRKGIKCDIALYSDYSVCFYAKNAENQTKYQADFVDEAKKRNLKCLKEINYNFAELKSNSSIEIKKDSKLKALEKEIAELKQKNKELQNSKQIKQNPTNEIGSGFYVSKFRHIVTNQHVVNQCKKITVGDSISTQISADLIASDKRNDLAILQTISMEMASAETKSFIQNLSIEIVPIVSGGLIRIEDVKGGEQVYVAGFPHGNMISDSMRLVPGLVNSTRGFENDITQFETDAVIRKGNSGGPVYDSRGNIVGIAVKRFNVTRSDNYNFAIKGSTVKQFLDAHNILTTPANRTSAMTSTKIYNIASKQTVMVVCHR